MAGTVTERFRKMRRSVKNFIAGKRGNAQPANPPAGEIEPDMNGHAARGQAHGNPAPAGVGTPSTEATLVGATPPPQYNGGDGVAQTGTGDYLGATHAVSIPSAPSATSSATSGVAPEDIAIVNDADAEAEAESGDQVPKTATRERSFLPPENPPQVTMPP